MDPVSFFPFHNRHIRFSYKGQIMSGVIVDSIPYDEKDFGSQYVYIPTNKMIDWKNAEAINDEVTMKAIEQKIDVLRVNDPSLITRE
jgi:hypothetical protein